MHEPPPLFLHEIPNALVPRLLTLQVCPGNPRITRLLLEVAEGPLQMKATLPLVPNGFAVIELLPEMTPSPVEAIPH